MRKRIHEILGASSGHDALSSVYDVFMILVIIVSLLPLNFKGDWEVFEVTDNITAVIFILDYLLRWMTADFDSKDRPAVAFLKYPFTTMAIIDLLSILPSLDLLDRGFMVLRVFRMLRAMRVLRLLKLVRYSKNLPIIMNVIRKTKKPLITVGILAVGYVYVSALIIFNVEPDTFDTLYDAVYWAMISLTTVGYGDIYPVSLVGRAIAMFSSFFGIAVVALPAGIITAGFMEEINAVDRNGGEEDGAQTP